MTHKDYRFATVEELIHDFKAGQFIILVDDEDRENEGDVILAADHVTPEKINFMAKEARGLICLSMTDKQVEKLQLPMMYSEKHAQGKANTAFTMSIEASVGVTTGISASDRSQTVWAASRPDAKPADVICPGHIFPLRAHPGGVLSRSGHTEASVEYAKLSGLNPSAIICEVMNDDGSMSRLNDLIRFSKTFNIKIGSIAELIKYLKVSR